MKSFLSTLFLAFFLLTMNTPAEAGRFSRMPTFESVAILKSERPNAEKIVHDALLKAVQERDWTVVKDGGKTLRLRLDVRKHMIEVDVRIVGGAVTVTYVDSRNMDYDPEGGATTNSGSCMYVTDNCAAGGPVIHPNYGSWIKKLLATATKIAR